MIDPCKRKIIDAFKISEDDAGVPGFGFLQHQFHSSLRIVFIEMTERFIQQQKIKRLHECAYDGNALLLSV